MNETFQNGICPVGGLRRLHGWNLAKKDTIAYIQGQAEHHRKRNFEEEFLAFLKKNAVEYDPQHVGDRFKHPYGMRVLVDEWTRR